MLPQVAWLILQSLERYSGHWVKSPNPAGKKWKLKLGGISQNCWITSYRIGQHQKLAHCKKSIPSLPGQSAKATGGPRMGFAPQLNQSAFYLRKGCYQQATTFTIVYTQASINIGHRKEGSPKAYKTKGD